MGGEDQLKALIRQAFRLIRIADESVVGVDDVLAQVMANIKRLVETMPEEGLLRNKAWRDVEPLVRLEVEKYSYELGRSVVNAEVAAAPSMRNYAIREFEHGGAALPAAVSVRNQPVPRSVEMALNSDVSGKTVRKLFNMDSKAKGLSPVAKALFKTVDTRVRAGIINGWPTRDIADLMAVDVVARGVPGVKLTAPAAKQIRSQAMTIARTAVQDMQRQVKEKFYEDNKDQLDGMVWMWSTALDSRTCETCAPLDQKRWPQFDKSRPRWPVHPNCRCQTVLIDPTDDFWNETERTAQQIRPVAKGVYKTDTAYKTPITIKGKKYYRQTITVTSDKPPTTLADVYARWATSPKNRKPGGGFRANTCQIFLPSIQRVQQGSRSNPPGDAHWQTWRSTVDTQWRG